MTDTVSSDFAPPLASTKQTSVSVSASASTSVGSGAEVDYAEFTSIVSVTATSEGTADDIVAASAHTFDGLTAIWLEFWCERIVRGTTSISIEFFDGSTGIGGVIAIADPGSGDPMFMRRRLTPSAGAHTYSVKAWVDAGTGQAQAGPGGAAANLPGYIRIVNA